jgi:hypothetical protein
MIDERVKEARQLIDVLNVKLSDLARDNVCVDLEVVSRNYIGTGMGLEGVHQLQATFLRKL